VYWIFATPWLIHYLDAQKHAAGEDLFDQPGLHHMYLYAAHAQLPGGTDDFDFGDVYGGPISRAEACKRNNFSAFCSRECVDRENAVSHQV
jgi:hypothetical protein